METLTNSSVAERVKAAIRDIPDFPKEGIVFKDITPILMDHQLCNDIADAIVNQVKDLDIQAIACVEARGFLFGPIIAQKMKIPFVPIRKKGKLPYKTVSHEYELEYGSAIIEMHEDAVVKGSRVLIHDDLLATGGTAAAAAELIGMYGHPVAFSFLVDLTFLKGSEVLSKYSKDIFSVVAY